jgi:hypothetical protein
MYSQEEEEQAEREATEMPQHGGIHIVRTPTFDCDGKHEK